MISEQFGCPTPCKQTSYKITRNYSHKNTWPYTDDEGGNKETCFTLMFYFSTHDIQQEIENLDYDFGNFLVSAGGNLGLFLGFSCLSVLFAFIKFVKKFFFKDRFTTLY
jgi:hypothetical protein